MTLASAAPPAAFPGFSPDAIQFLADLAENNDRAWFQPRKAEFERLLKTPLEEFIAALGDRLAARAVPMLADPSRAPFRIYRDTRFSKDKSPYKTNVGASFPWLGDADSPAEPNRHGIGGYFHLQPGEIYVGGGMWHPEKPRIDAFRRAVVEDPEAAAAALEDTTFARTFGRVGTDGESLRRVPPGFPADHPRADWLKLKDIVFGRRLTDAEATSPALPDIVADSFAAATPVLRYLARVTVA
jgi:uncharacterized protein (TIGR02453 family)